MLNANSSKTVKDTHFKSIIILLLTDSQKNEQSFNLNITAPKVVHI